ncbi:hypothetical protein CHOED_024 [Vibrio phage CHOED]|uniref:hypothetical protein n=1 Tax=Vibrio phage CHOED TaxID=1458716 RepID=UPI00042E88EC|nr:hypothetical protein CHOED_024 [Vibrio phage CHOED]AHK11884.1 hypothetical protein CHOED_024 [Vibrio phage CHOED]
MIIHVHYHNHKAYCKCNQEVMIQENGIWVPAVLYYSQEEPNKYFVRSQDEFGEKFIEVDVPLAPQHR